MNERHCHRCESLLHAEEEGTLLFCWNCGAAQVTLSEELREKAEEQAQSFAAATSEEAGQGFAPPADPAAVVWRAAIVILALVAAGASLLSMIFPPLALLVPAIALTVYASRFRKTRISAGVGLRFGLLGGLFTALGMTLISAVAMLASRFVSGQSTQMDANTNAAMMQIKARAVAQSGQAAADMFNLLSIPEFRAGLFLSGTGMLVAVLLALCAAGGALAGYVRSRTPAR